MCTRLAQLSPKRLKVLALNECGHEYTSKSDTYQAVIAILTN